MNFIAKNITSRLHQLWISSIIEWKNKFAILEHLVLLGYTLLCSNSLLYYICYILFDFSRWLHHRFILSNRMSEFGKMFLNSWQWALWFINLRKMFAYSKQIHLNHYVTKVARAIWSSLPSVTHSVLCICQLIN